MLFSLIQALSAADAAQPIQQPWSSRTYGPDGPWNAVTLNVAGQSVDLLVGSFYQSYLLSDNYCQNRTLFALHSCDATSAGLVSSDNSDLGDSANPQFRPYPTWAAPISMNGTAVDILPFDFQIPVNNPPTMSAISTGLVDSAWESLLDGTTYPITLGTLSLGAPSFNQTFGSINYGIPTSSLFTQGLIPSASVGLHIGAASFGLAGSMFWGGYDRTRVIGDVLVRASGTQSAYLGVDLLDIGIGTAVGGSPFNFTQLDGLLALGNSSIGSSVQTQPQANTPYLYLPKSTCDAIASNLPVTYQSKYGLYFWNTNDPQYSRIVSSASFLSFTFRADDLPAGNLTVKVPWRLLNLTLTEPIINTPTQYFPCRPDTGNFQKTYTLGQAFLQAAFIAIDWKPQSPPGNWFMAQAPGPNIDSSPFTAAMQTGVSQLQSSGAAWEDTWTGHWTPLPSDPSSTPSSQLASPSSASSSSLSTGAKAGIGVGAAAAAIFLLLAIGALLFVRRRRRNKAVDEGSNSTYEHTAAYAPAMATSGHQKAGDSEPLKGYYGDSTDTAYELDGVMPARELPAHKYR